MLLKCYISKYEIIAIKLAFVNRVLKKNMMSEEHPGFRGEKNVDSSGSLL